MRSASCLAPARVAPRVSSTCSAARRARPRSSRRWLVSASGDGSSLEDVDAAAKRRYVNVTGFPFPLTPLLSRKTVAKTLVPGRVWTFEQEQGIGLGLGVSTSVVMTVVKLRDGRLWVHDPIAPTAECLELLAEHCGSGAKESVDVAYVVLATTQYEHKIFVGPFARRFPKAQVWVAPGQFSFPANLPSQFFGIFPAGELDTDGSRMPWRDEIDTKLLRLPPLFWNQYTYCEAAFLHRDSGAMIVTDAAVFVSERPPEIIPRETLIDLGAEDGFTISLLRFGNYRGGRDLPGSGGDRVETPELCERIGWRRMALFSLFIAPDARNVLRPERSFAGLAGKFVVSPIVFAVVFQFHRTLVWEWAASIESDWGDEAKHVVSAHFPAFSADGDGAKKEKEKAARKFAEAFEWAATPRSTPKEYADANDMQSLELLVRVLRFLKAVPDSEQRV